MDPLGRRALTLAIDNENLEMVELLVIMGVETKDALLHAINAEFVEAVELLLEHEELIYKEGEPYVSFPLLFLQGKKFKICQTNFVAKIFIQLGLRRFILSGKWAKKGTKSMLQIIYNWREVPDIV